MGEKSAQSYFVVTCKGWTTNQNVHSYSEWIIQERLSWTQDLFIIYLFPSFKVSKQRRKREKANRWHGYYLFKTQFGKNHKRIRQQKESLSCCFVGFLPLYLQKHLNLWYFLCLHSLILWCCSAHMIVRTTVNLSAWGGLLWSIIHQ